MVIFRVLRDTLQVLPVVVTFIDSGKIKVRPYSPSIGSIVFIEKVLFVTAVV